MTINKIIASLAMCIAAVAFVSCQGSEGVLYEISKQEVAFASTMMNTELTKGDNGIIKVPVYRNSKNGALDVSVALESKSEAAMALFTLKNKNVSFADGAAVAYAEIAFEMNDLGATDVYELNLLFANADQVSPSGIKAIKIKANRKLTFESIGKGLFTSQLFGSSWEVEFMKAKEGNIYVAKNLVEKNFDILFSLSEDGNSLNSFAAQETGYKYENTSMVFIVGKSMERNGKNLSILCEYVVPGVGSFGEMVEIFTLP